MRKIFTLSFLVFNLFCFSQNKGHILLNWKLVSVKDDYGIVLNNSQFVDTNLYYADASNSLVYGKKVSDNVFADTTSLEISNLNTIEISENEFLNLEKSNKKSDPHFNLSNVYFGDLHNVYLSFNPVYQEGSRYLKIVSFDYTFKTKTFDENRTQKLVGGPLKSVLSSGDWRRFYVEKSGVYKLTKSFLKQIGVNVNVDPRTLKVFSYGGKMLPLKNSQNKFYDLPELAIQFVGESDGVFDDTDYILMYCEGIENWSPENLTHRNLYADKAYYYVTSSTDLGKRIQDFVQPTEVAIANFNTYDSYAFYEVDKLNVGALGRKWFGEDLSLKASNDFVLTLPNLDLTQTISLQLNSATVSSTFSNLNVNVYGTLVSNVNYSSITNSAIKYVEGFSSVNKITAVSDNLAVSLIYKNGGNPNAKCYLDYLAVQGKSFLKGYGKQYSFRVKQILEKNGVCQLDFTNVSTVAQFWDVTELSEVKTIRKANESNFSFKVPGLQVNEFVLVENTDFYEPKFDNSTVVANQDLKGQIFLDNQNKLTALDYLVVCPANLQSQAERLADFHRNYSKLNVKVVSLDKIYQEFSSGKQDISAIRNFVKYIYENNPNGAKLKYLCLFGDASFDYKDRIKNNTNIVPVFQSLNSSSLAGTYVSDDFFGMLDANEGDLVIGNQGADVAVGRILVSNLLQAQQMVDKIIEYHSENAMGKWRNNIVFLADDIDKSSDATLEQNLNAMSDEITTNKPFFNSKKIFLDAYKQEITSGGQKYPKAKEEFLTAFEQGALVVDYLGHGGEIGLSAERMFELADAKAIYNRYKYPLFVTVTCEFTRFDNPLAETGGEVAFQNPTGGPIALVTTTRQIGQANGEGFNTDLAKYLFAYDGNSKMSIAEAVRRTKAESMDPGVYLVSFIGDPAMHLAIADPEIKITKINDVLLKDFSGALEALGKVKMTGEVVDENGALLSGFNGELFVNIYDKFIDKTTLGNDGDSFLMKFKTLGETIFRGNATVKNGVFEINFVLPKDIMIPVGAGKISLYAKETGSLRDRTGAELSVKIGGVNANAPVDKTPPVVKLFLNDKTFVSGGIVNQNPILIAELSDQNGINTASGIGHDIIAYLDGNETKPIVLNDYYNTQKDDFSNGVVKFQFRNLAPGMHTLVFKAWDVYNNLVTSELSFVVIDNSELELTNVLNYPNPFVNYTEFWFNHNKANEPLEVIVQVMTVTGRLVWQKNTTILNTGFRSRDIVWDGKDDFGDAIGKGVYIYKLTVKSTLSDKKAEKFEKLVIL